MIDLHCHLLHEMDDGAQSLSEAVEMCRIAEMNNISHICLTSHFEDFSQIDAFLNRRAEKFKQLKAELESRDIFVELSLGAEVAAMDGLMTCNRLPELALNNSRYLLLEFPFEFTPRHELFDYIKKVSGAGLIPVIAHPERFSYIQSDLDILEELSLHNVLIQVNATSLLGEWGGRVRKAASVLLENDWIHVIASDAHSVNGRNNDMLQFASMLSDYLSDDQLTMVMDTIPKAILDNVEITFA